MRQHVAALGVLAAMLGVLGLPAARAVPVDQIGTAPEAGRPTAEAQALAYLEADQPHQAIAVLKNSRSALKP